MMTTREHWIGYLLGALDDEQQSAVQQELNANPVAAAEVAKLEKHLSLLDDGLHEELPPNRLAARTLSFLDKPHIFRDLEEDVFNESPAGAADAPSTKSASESVEPVSGSYSRFSLTDALVAVGACVAAVAIFFPALASSRMLASQMKCENNLRQVGFALHEFATGNAEKRYPKIAPRGPLAVAGSYAPRLLNDGFVRHQEVVACPEIATSEDAPQVPSVDQLLSAPQDKVAEVQQGLANVYNYNLGMQIEGETQAPIFAGRAMYPIASDVVVVENGKLAPRAHADGRFNILFDDGHVEYVRLDELPNFAKQFFLNDRGQVAAGLDEDDAVIANGTAFPLSLPEMQLAD